MSRIEYDSSGLREGATGHRRCTGAAQDAAGTLDGASVVSTAFGRVGAAHAFAGALGTAKDHSAQGARAASESRATQAGGNDTTADLGDGLATTTHAIADSARAQRIADSM
ncbi:MAG: hypothetical protein ACRDSR_20640 [Pseudonocardiaceae bacterium]